MAKLNQTQYLNEAVEKQLGFAASVQAGNIVNLSGLIAMDEQMNIVAPGDMAGQITQIYNLMEMVLELHNATLANVVNEFIFVTDLAALNEAAATRVARYADCEPPATTAVQVVGLFSPEAMIEIQATAIVDS